MRVVHVITGLPTGGAQVMLHNLVAGMDARRFESSVISLVAGGAYAEKLSAAGAPVYEVGMSPGRPTPGALARLARLAREQRPDLVQGWMYHGNLAAQFAAAVARAPALWNITSANFEAGGMKPLTAAAVRMCGRLSALPRAIVNCSHFSARRHEELFGFRGHKSHVIPNGFDTARFAPSAAARASVRDELGVEPGAVLVGLMARSHPVKDHANFLSAAALIAPAHPHVYFVLAGENVDGSNAELGALVARPELRGRTRLLGSRTDMTRLTAALDIAVSSSYSEAFPLVVGEAMASAVPCVVTDVGDSSLLVGETGRVVAPRNSPELARAMLELIEAGGERRELMGRRARARIKERYSLDSVVRAYESLYERVAGGAADLGGKTKCAA